MQTNSIILKPALTVTAQRTDKNWKELPYDELSGAPTLNRASVSHVYEGDIEGESWEEYLRLYSSDDTCSFISMERVIGSVDGRSGSFVIQGIGTYTNGMARGQLNIVPGSGSGDLVGLQGKGFFIAPKGQSSSVTLYCDFEHVKLSLID